MCKSSSYQRIYATNETSKEHKSLSDNVDAPWIYLMALKCAVSRKSFKCTEKMNAYDNCRLSLDFTLGRMKKIEYRIKHFLSNILTLFIFIRGEFFSCYKRIALGSSFDF